MDTIITGDFHQKIFDVLFSNYSGIFILLDENTKQHCWPIIEPYLKTSRGISINPSAPISHGRGKGEVTENKINRNAPIQIQITSGEIHKNLETCEHIWQELINNHADRNSVLVNVGGGVLCDIGAFAASTYKRGIDYIHIPTTLLAQVDASIGGKTGINFQLLKNQIGTFCNPKAVVINNIFLQTLNQRELLCGYAEMIKHALIDSNEYWGEIKTKFKQSPPSPLGEGWGEVIKKSIDIKQKIVLQDPHENGIRKILNFGHTIGHAIETLSLEKDEISLTHGEAIAIGMICESFISKEVCSLSQIDLDDITQFILSIYPNYNILGFEDKLLLLMAHDKKNVNNAINFTLLKEIGKPLFNQTCSLDIIKNSFKYYRDSKIVKKSTNN